MIKNKHYQKVYEQQNKLVVKQGQRVNVEVEKNTFTNGRPVPYDDYDAKDLQYNWKVHQPCRQKHTSLDFIKVNKHIIINNQDRQTVKNQSQMVKKKPNGQVTYDIMLPEFGHQYGLLNRPSTPIQHVVQGTYGSTYDYRQQLVNDYYLDQMKQKTTNKSNLTPIRQTNATKLQKDMKDQQINPNKLKPLFKMNKFKQVGSLLQSQMGSCSQSQHNFHQLRSQHTLTNNQPQQHTTEI